MRSRYLFYLMILIVAFSSCKKSEETCSDVDLGVLSYLTSSMDSVPYLDKSSVVFKDSLGQEITYTLQFGPDDTLSSLILTNCPLRPTDTITYHFNARRMKVRLENDSIPFFMEISLMTLLDWTNAKPYDCFIVDNFVSDSGVLQNMDILINRREVPEARATYINSGFDLEPEFSIFGETFRNVYHLSYMDYNSPFKMYYNTSEGIVSFKDEHGKRWVFSRFEQ